MQNGPLCLLTIVTAGNKQSFVIPRVHAHVVRTQLRARLSINPQTAQYSNNDCFLYFSLSVSLASTAEEEGDPLPSLLCLHSRHRLTAVWLQHWSHQRTRAGLCVCVAERGQVSYEQKTLIKFSYKVLELIIFSLFHQIYIYFKY